MIEESNSNYIFTYFLHLSFNKNVAIQKGFRFWFQNLHKIAKQCGFRRQNMYQGVYCF